jgi:hypothetical protein
MDGNSFDELMVGEIHSSMVDCIYNLHSETVYKRTDEEMLADLRAADTARVDEVQQDSKSDDDDDDDDDDLQSPFQKMLYKKVAEQRTNRVGTNLPTRFEQHYENKRKTLKENVQEEVQNYLNYCKDLNIEQLLDTYGTDEYFTMKLNKDKTIKKIFQSGDPLKCSNLFDLMKWWRNYGCKKYQLLGSAASVALGKPTHNGFQERVFSRGTYQDCKLKKRMSEDGFEMAILNALNFRSLEDLQKKLTMSRPDCSKLVINLKEFFVRANDPDVIIERPTDEMSALDDIASVLEDSSVTSITEDETDIDLDSFDENEEEL